MKLILLVFAFFFILNVLSSGGHVDWWDGTEAFLVTESMALKHTAKLDPTVPSVKGLGFNVNYTVYANTALQTGKNPQNVTLEPVYTVRSLLLSATAVPFYYVATLLSVSPFATVGLLVNSLFLSLTAVTIFYIIIEIKNSKRIAFVLSLIFAVCTFVWPYNSTFWVQPIQGLLLAISLYLLLLIRHRNGSFICLYTVLKTKHVRFLAGLTGIILGLSVFAHPISIIYTPAFLLYSFFAVMRQQKSNFVILTTSLGAVLFLVGLTNFARFNSFTEFGYGYFSTLQAHDGWTGLIGLLVSPGSGLIFYFPLVILVPLGAKYMYKENKGLLFFCLYIFISTWLYTGTLSFGSEPTSWSGGIAWGPRYLVPTIPFLIIVLAYLFPQLRKRHFLKSMVIGLCLIGFYINLSAILVWFQYGLMYAWTMEGLSIYPNYMDFVTWSPSHSPIILHAKALMSDYVTTIFPQQYLNTSWSWTAYGNAPCEYDLYIYCKLGVAPFIVGNLALATLSVIIIKKIRLFRFVRKERALLLLASILPVRRFEKHR
ncbi:MAG TPA: hypothetical protein VFG77_04545 [Nitrososphaeraceae archaeon]|nr:hypothetical protein [Nitrososphaeraceae archaeon]